MYRMVLFVVFMLSVVISTSPPAHASEASIVCPSSQSPNVILAARELQRYAYQRTGELLPIVDTPPIMGDVIVPQVDPALQAQQYRLHTRHEGDRQVLHITGGTDVSVLYAVYRLAETMGIRFYLDGDVIPDHRVAWKLPVLDVTEQPLFEHRGIQPFHDFTEGPDWWLVDDYKAYLSQMVKLRMNWFGLHCYPEGGVGPEPLVWIGLPEDVDARGKVKFSYPSRWASTAGGAWGYASTKTSAFCAGAAMLFETDDFGPDVTAGCRPKPATPEDCNAVFDRAADMLHDAFSFGRRLGIKICLGTETPLTIPRALQERLRSMGIDPSAPETVRRLYEGMFTRIKRSCPIDYYWLWTPEGWTWSGVDTKQVDATVADIQTALAALERVQTPFGFATCGWVLGPPSDRGLFDKTLPKSVALSCINREVGFTPVEPGFARIKGRPKWAIPWMEDDPALIIPQLWVGRLRRDAADAYGYGCTGLMGIHWRTKVLGPNVAALADAGWEQRAWNTDFGQPIILPEPKREDVHVGGSIANYARNQIANTDQPGIYQTCLYNVQSYRLKVPNGSYKVTLQFCEIHYDESGKRVFGVKLQNKPVIDRLDVFAKVGKNRALDYTFADIRVTDGVLDIGFVKQVEYPFIAGIVVEGSGTTRKINCGGAGLKDYAADLPAANVDPFPDKPRDMPSGDFYRDWCQAQFGTDVGLALAEIFAGLDGGLDHYDQGRGTHLPRPATWIGGPGGIAVNNASWETEKKRYAFVDHLEAERPKVRGAGNLARFDYWLNTFQYLRSIGHLGCLRGQLDQIVQQLEKQSDPAKKTDLAAEALRVRVDLARQWERMLWLQIAVVSTPGEMGTIANLEQHVRRQLHFLDIHDAKLAQVLGHGLPRDATPIREYHGPARVIVPTKRSQVREEEALTLKVLVPAAATPNSVVCKWRPLGTGKFSTLPCQHVQRAVYRVRIPAARTGLEYYIEAHFSDNQVIAWPPTAPELNQTVVVVPHDTQR